MTLLTRLFADTLPALRLRRQSIPVIVRQKGRINERFVTCR